MSTIKCETCDNAPMVFAWTDTHGVGQCTTCGTPYRIYHYDADHKRIEKPPMSIVGEPYKPMLRQYWQETQSIIPSACSFPGGYELASPAHERQFYDWLNAREEASHDE